MVNLRYSLLVFLTTTLCSCSRSPLELVPVSGTVKFEDGSVPAGEIRTVSFEPVSGWQGKKGPRLASAELQNDGSFKAMTLAPDDGVVPGEYKVVLVFFKSRVKLEPILPEPYGKFSKTPIPPVTIRVDDKNYFDFVVKKRAGH